MLLFREALLLLLLLPLLLLLLLLLLLDGHCMSAANLWPCCCCCCCCCRKLHPTQLSACIQKPFFAFLEGGRGLGSSDPTRGIVDPSGVRSS